MPNPNNVDPRPASKTTDRTKRHNARDAKTRFNVRLPTQLMDKLKADSNRTGRSISDIVIEQLWYRYPNE